MPRAVHFRRVVLGEKSWIFEPGLQLSSDIQPPLAELWLVPTMQHRQLGIEGVLVPQVAQLDQTRQRRRDYDEQRDGIEEQRPFVDRHCFQA